mgnify:CR=1 FL=1
MSMERKCQLSENMGNNIELDLISVEKHLIQKVLQHTNGYKPEAARLLGIGLTTLYKKMEAYNVEHFVLAYPVGYLKQAACLFIYLFKMKRIFSF